MGGTVGLGQITALRTRQRVSEILCAISHHPDPRNNVLQRTKELETPLNARVTQCLRWCLPSSLIQHPRWMPRHKKLTEVSLSTRELKPGGHGHK